jgi:hypothetical protein
MNSVASLGAGAVEVGRELDMVILADRSVDLAGVFVHPFGNDLRTVVVVKIVGIETLSL